MPEFVDAALRPLVQKLSARYPNVRVVEARLTRWDDGFLQQLVRYRAPLEELKRAGLVTHEMLEQAPSGHTPIGDAFHLSECGEAGSMELDLCTESVPRTHPQTRGPCDVLKKLLERCSR